MDVIMTYKKNDRVKRISDVEFVEVDLLLKRFYYWKRGSEKAKSVGLRFLSELKINATQWASVVGGDDESE